MKTSLKRKHALPDLVCDTSPIQYLHQTGMLYLLRELGQCVCLPPAVEKELVAGQEFGINLPDLKQVPWIAVVRPKGEQSVRLLSDMGPGETEVLMLALERKGFVAILDDYSARRRAFLLGIPFSGTLGLLLDAKKAGLISQVKPVLNELTKLQFRLAPHTREMILRKAG